MKLRHILSRCAIGATFVLAVSGCGGSDGDQVTVSQTEPTTATAEAGDAADSAQAEAPKTLEEYLGPVATGQRGQGGFGGEEGEILAEQRLLQQAIQACMQAQGFDYVPEEVGDGLQFFLATQNQGVDPADYAATQGFGISTRFDALLEGDVELDEASNPNDEHLATLSDGEADAWNLALNGEPPERNAQGQLIDPETGEVLQRGQGARGGCQGAAQTEVRGEAVVLGELEDELALLSDRIDSDPRITEIRREWVDCMREEGFDYADENEARADINSQVRPLLRSFFASGDAAPAQGEGGQGRQGAGNQLQVIAGLQLTPEQDAELEALQDLERSTAVASLACQGDTAAEIAEITAGYEADFVESNRSALEALSS